MCDLQYITNSKAAMRAECRIMAEGKFPIVHTLLNSDVFNVVLPDSRFFHSGLWLSADWTGCIQSIDWPL